MKKYTVTFLFTNLDNSLYTDSQAKMTFNIESDNYSHARLLVQQLARTLGADEFDIEEVVLF